MTQPDASCWIISHDDEAAGKADLASCPRHLLRPQKPVSLLISLHFCCQRASLRLHLRPASCLSAPYPDTCPRETIVNMFRGRKGGNSDENVMATHGQAPDMAIYGGSAFGHSVSPTAHLFGRLISSCPAVTCRKVAFAELPWLTRYSCFCS